MKVKDIPGHMGQTQTGLADQLGVSRQAMSKYLNGQRGTESKFVRELLAVTNLQGEYVVFPDTFDHPDGEDKSHPAHHLNIAIEALREAQKRGIDARDIIQQIVNIGEPTLSELPYGPTPRNF